MSTQDKKKRLRNKADRLYQEIGKKRYSDCLICGSEYSCLHHYHPKSTCSALRYNLENGIPVCYKCHCRIHSSDDPTPNEIILKRKGEAWKKRLQKIKKEVEVKTTLTYYQGEIEKLKKELEQTIKKKLKNLIEQLKQN